MQSEGDASRAIPRSDEESVFKAAYSTPGSQSDEIRASNKNTCVDQVKTLDSSKVGPKPAEGKCSGTDLSALAHSTHGYLKLKC